MHTTPSSLLERLRRPGEPEAWGRFVELYTPLIYAWARRCGLRHDEVMDLTQDVFALLLAKLPEFRYDPGRSFRAWLRTVTLNRWREAVRRRSASVPARGGLAVEVVAAEPDPVVAFEEVEYRAHLVARAVQLMQGDFHDTTWRACWEQVVAGRPAAEVAAALGLSVASAYAAKSRVLRRLRQELDGLLD